MKSLFSKVKRLFFKNTILGSTTLVDSRTGLESDWGKERYTLGALAMQDNGWRFAESPSSYGFLKFIDTFDARKKKTRG